MLPRVSLVSPSTISKETLGENPYENKLGPANKNTPEPPKVRLPGMSGSEMDELMAKSAVNPESVQKILNENGIYEATPLNELARGITAVDLPEYEADEGVVISEGVAKQLKLQRIHATGINDPVNIDNRLNALSTSDGAIFKVKRKPGRPPGSKTYHINKPLTEANIRRKRYTRDAIDRMTSLGFDPLAAQIKVFRIAERELDDQCKLKYAPETLTNGDVRRFSPRAVNDLLGIMQKCASELMTYKYTKPEPSKEQEDSIPPLIIGLGDGTTLEQNTFTQINEVKNYVESEFDLDEGLLANVVKVAPDGSVSPVEAGEYDDEDSDSQAYTQEEGLADVLVDNACDYAEHARDAAKMNKDK